MSFSLGVFEVYGDALPGGFLLAVIYYIAWRNDIIDLSEQAGANSVVLLIVAFAISMIVGNLLGPAWLTAERLLRRHLPDTKEQGIAKFKMRNAEMGARPYASADLALLRSALQMTNTEAAREVMSLQARTKMIYNSTIPIAMAAVVAGAEVFLEWGMDFAVVAALEKGMQLCRKGRSQRRSFVLRRVVR